MSIIPVPIPDRVAAMIGGQLPAHILQAEFDAFDAAVTVSRCRTPYTRVAREAALSELRVANKLLAAYNPLLILKPGGGSRG